ncbi:TonB-dependent siderophore receptor [Photobacterium ganghwense]|uniref:TonB-dependent siderophore receptor n=1 Tax=Photobacterium ganghwense TaxID=320778 RepID=UPI001C2CE478|nr:TonB-dependent siderophore receptor [Photobacterium ganghwense]MBV1839670.1 TonB-dependent siderophore receptor [Photobacterium ganghwense]
MFYFHALRFLTSTNSVFSRFSDPLASITASLLLVSGASVYAEETSKGGVQETGKARLNDTYTVTVTADKMSDEGNGPVRGYVAEQSRVGTKTNTSILETPQSVSVITREQMDTQQPVSSSSALRYTAGATSEKYGGYGGYLDITRIRGVDADYYLDGLRIISNPGSWLPQIDPYSLERIEVLRGPASAIYGQGTGGGIVNQVSRKPQDVALHELNLQYGSFNRKQIGFDSTGPINDDGTFLYRFTASSLDTEGQVEDTRHKRLYVVPSLTWQPNLQTSWTIIAMYSQEPELPNYNSLPAAVLGLDGSLYPQINRRRNFTDMNFENSSRQQSFLSSLFEYDFENSWRLVSNARYMYVKSDIQRGVVYGYQEVNGSPQLKGYYELTPAKVNTFSMDNHLIGNAEWGDMTHTILMGVDYAKGTLKNELYSVGPILLDPYGSQYRPNIVPDFTASRLAPWKVKQEFTRVGAYLQDQMAYDRWRLVLSARHDWSQIDDETHSYSPTSRVSKQDDTKWSGRAGLSYQFDIGLAPYISYATSFDPLLGTDYQGEPFVPVESEQTEVGIKFHPANSSTLLTAAVFQLEQTNVKTSDADHLGFNTQAGKVRTRGLDLQATTEMVSNLNLIANYTYLDNDLVKDTSYQGKSLTQTPKHSASIWMDYLIDYDAFSGLKLGGGVRYLGKSFGDPSNDFEVPSATVIDLAATYQLDSLSSELSGATLAFNVSNLTDKQYVASCTSRLYCFVGQERSMIATLSYRW